MSALQQRTVRRDTAKPHRDCTVADFECFDVANVSCRYFFPFETHHPDSATPLTSVADQVFQNVEQFWAFDYQQFWVAHMPGDVGVSSPVGKSVLPPSSPPAIESSARSSAGVSSWILTSIFRSVSESSRNISPVA